MSPDTENEDRPQRNLYAKFIKGRIWEQCKKINLVHCASCVISGCLIIFLHETSFIESFVKNHDLVNLLFLGIFMQK